MYSSYLVNSCLQHNSPMCSICSSHNLALATLPFGWSSTVWQLVVPNLGIFSIWVCSQDSYIWESSWFPGNVFLLPICLHIILFYIELNGRTFHRRLSSILMPQLLLKLKTHWMEEASQSNAFYSFANCYCWLSGLQYKGTYVTPLSDIYFQNISAPATCASPFLRIRIWISNFSRIAAGTRK
jgi:hypothetical protein